MENNKNIDASVELSENSESLEIKNSNIVYSKFNPLIIKNNDNKVNKILNTIKYTIALSMGMFLILSLWIFTIWEKNTLIGLGIDIAKINSSITVGQLTAEQLKNPIFSSGLIGFGSISLDNAWLQSLLAFGILSLIFIIPVLIFKNGTLLNIVSMGFGFLLLIITATLFFMGISAQSELVSVAKELNASLSPLYQNRVNELFAILLRIIGI